MNLSKVHCLQLLMCVSVGLITSRGVFAQNHSTKEGADEAIGDSPGAHATTMTLGGGYRLLSSGSGTGYSLTLRDAKSTLAAPTLEGLEVAIRQDSRIPAEDKKTLLNQLKNKSLIKNFLAQNVCRKSQDVVDVEVQPTQKLIELFENIRKGKPANNDQEVVVSFNSINDNFGHGAGRRAGMKKGTAFEGDDQGMTFGMELNTLVTRGNDSYSMTLLDHLYTKSAANMQRRADGAHYQDALDKSAINVSAVRGFDANGKSTYYFRFEGEGGCEADQGGLSQRLQKTWHEVGSGKKLADEDHMAAKYYIAGKLGAGKRMVFYQNGRSSVSALLETGVQGATTASEDNALYCSSKLLYAGKFCQLEIFADTNTSGSYKVGVGADKKITKNISVSGGAYYLRNALTKEYGDNDMLHELGFKVGF